VLPSLSKWGAESVLVLVIACSGCGGASTTEATPASDTAAPSSDTNAAGAGDDGGADGPRKTPCPDVPKPNEGRVAACEQKGGRLEGRETDGCVRGYECVMP